MSAFHDNALMGASGSQGYQISRSVRLRSSASAYLNRTYGSPTNQAKWTFSAWMKIGGIGSNLRLLSGGTAASDTATFDVVFNSGTLLLVGNAATFRTSNAVFRDPSAWYHLVLAVDTTQGTEANKLLAWINGVSVSWASTSAITTCGLNANTSTVSIGRFWNGGGNYWDGYLTEVNFIDGQALTPSSFGENDTVTGVWKPKKYAGTYGTNGFYLNFSDNSNNTAATIGKDYSGNGNNWTPNNISVTSGVTYDSMLDVPTLYADGGNGRGNYCVMNPLKTGGIVASNGNLTITGSASGTSTIVGSIGVSSGKWYWEYTVGSTDQNSMIGICTDSATLTNWVGSDANGWSYYGVNGNKYNSGTATAYGASYTSGDIIGTALDLDAGTLVFYKNNSSQGTAFSGLASGTYFPAIGDSGSAATPTGSFNFGQRPFAYTPPSGYVALNTQNLPAPTISNGALYMAATTYTGTGASNTISNGNNNTIGTTFKPDLVWIKSRSAATDHKLTDSVRGTTKALISNTTGAETTDANGLTAFGNTGFTVGSDTTYNNNTATYVGWQWKAGAGTTSSNTSGSITSTVSVNATAGFSVVTYTGIAGNVAKTFGHGLGVAPSMVIVKGRDAGSTGVNDWVVWHSAFTGSEYIYLDLTNAKGTSANYWGATVPSSTVVTVGGNSSNVSNESGIKYVAYCFSAVAGYSAFGSYTGNGSSDGPFVYLGFRPRWLMVKRTSSGAGTANWVVLDTSRDTYNLAGQSLEPNLPDAEYTPASSGYPMDILSNGFKQRGASVSQNESGSTYIYAAFAENPFKLALAR